MESGKLVIKMGAGDMSEYINNWKAEHLAIKNILASAVKLDICSKAGQEKMREAKKVISQHLKGEDESLYPTLKQIARKNTNMARLLELFAMEMDMLSLKVFAFFKEYEENPARKGLSSELGEIIALLKIRIDKEENAFLKEYESMINQADIKKKVV